MGSTIGNNVRGVRVGVETCQEGKSEEECTFYGISMYMY